MSQKCMAAASRSVDGAVGVSDPERWYVAIVGPRHEKAVAKRLGEMGLDSFAATQKEMRVWADGRRRMIDRVVIPGMVFVHCSEVTRLSIVKLPSISRFMVNRLARRDSATRPVATIPAQQINRLRFMLGQTDEAVTFSPVEYRVDDNVRVVRGPLQGLEGHVTRNSDGSHTLTVSLDMLGGATVAINPLDIERL